MEREGYFRAWGAFPANDEQMPDVKSTNWAIEKINEKHDKPFFISVGFLRPHVPWYVPQKWIDSVKIKNIQLPPYLKDDQKDVPKVGQDLTQVPMMPTTEWAIQNNQWKNMAQAYLACILFVDHYVGEILNTLYKSPYKNNTIIILWSDHGYHLGEKNRFAKHSLWKEATKAPLIIYGAGIQANKKINQPVELLDIYPTLLDLCNLPAYTRNEGHSLRALMENPKSNWKYPAITTYARNNHALVYSNYRYIQYEDGSEELYNHSTDPNEWNNVASDPKNRSVKDQLKKFIPKINALWAKNLSTILMII